MFCCDRTHAKCLIGIMLGRSLASNAANRRIYWMSNVVTVGSAGPPGSRSRVYAYSSTVIVVSHVLLFCLSGQC